jgi:hypothetical protein
MNNLSKQITFLMLFLITQTGRAQMKDASLQVEEFIESLAEEQGEEAGAALIIEDLQEYAENPLNINTAKRHQLLRLHMLDDLRIQNLLDYLEAYGPAYAIFELNSIDGFNPELLTKMEPFIRFGPLEAEPQQLKKTLKYGRHEWMARATGIVQKAMGYKEREDGTVPFAGDRARYYSRYRFTSGDKISVGITAEKDPGESFFRGVNKEGFDFYSGHISMKVSEKVENIILGDFVVRSGQGLALWQGFATGKSGYATNISKSSQGVHPYSSSNENCFFRGFSTTLKWDDVRINFFCSHKNNDANLEDSDSSGIHFTSLQTSGYHRTAGEIADKNSVTDLNAGTTGTWQFQHLKIGYTFLYRHFEIPFLCSDQLYNRFHFRGTENFVTSFDYLFSKGNYRLFGEGAISGSKGKAALQGIAVHLHDRIQVCGLFRHFDKDYHALWASPFAEGSSADNESGFYFGAHILPFKYVTLAAYSDYFRSDGVSFTTAGPSTGREISSQAEIRPSKKIQIFIRYKNEAKEKKLRVEEKYENCSGQSEKIRLHIQYNPSNMVALKTRFEHVHHRSTGTENGYMVFQDLQLIPKNKRLNMAMRVAWFKTDSYNSRIYAYENDLLYSFSIPAYYGKGFRTYLNLKYKISDHAEIWFKLANTSLIGVEFVGTGYNEISGNRKTEVKFQVRLKI